MEISICAISDLHGNLIDNIIPSDILLIAGDISPLWCQSFKTEVDKWIKTKFLRWISSLPVKKVYLIPGNHDFFFENLTEYELNSLKTILAPKCELLIHEFTKYNCEDGTHISIFGTPYCKIFGNWAFMRPFDFLSEKFALCINQFGRENSRKTQIIYRSIISELLSLNNSQNT